MDAYEILEQAAKHMKDRASTYDKPEGERSIGATVKAFQAITGDGLMDTEERGWLFMILLKAVRSQQGDYRADSYEDGTAYFGLMGEAASRERSNNTKPGTTFPANIDTTDPGFTNFPENLTLPAWALYIGVDCDGTVTAFSHKPLPSLTRAFWTIDNVPGSRRQVLWNEEAQEAVRLFSMDPFSGFWYAEKLWV